MIQILRYLKYPLIFVPLFILGVFLRLSVRTPASNPTTRIPGFSAVAVFMTHGKVKNLERSMQAFFESEHHEKLSVLVTLDDAQAWDTVSALNARLEQKFNSKIQLILKPEEKHSTRLKPVKLAERRIDSHFFFALREALKTPHEFIVWIEDDIVIAPDFLQMMISGIKRLRDDKTLFCIAGWNEQALDGEAKDMNKLIRTSVFPGLGWMMHRAVVKELVDAWPGEYVTWDWWFRRGDVAKGRECIAPEVPRSKHIGADGTHFSNNDVYEQMALANIPASDDTFNFETIDLETYDKDIWRLLNNAHVVRSMGEFDEVFKAKKPGTFIVSIPSKYEDKKFKAYFKHFSSFLSNHRGLVVKRRPGADSLFVFINSRYGQEWLPQDLRSPLPDDVRVVVSEVGENCVDACARELKWPCSFSDLSMMQNCEFCAGGKDQCMSRNTFHTHNGLLVKNDACFLSKFAANSCDESFAGYSRTCPCALRRTYD